MGYGLDDVHDRMEAEYIDRAFDNYQKQRKLKQEQVRKIGYAEYDKFRNRLRRAWRILWNKPCISRKEWNAIVDEVVKNI